MTDNRRTCPICHRQLPDFAEGEPPVCPGCGSGECVACGAIGPVELNTKRNDVPGLEPVCENCHVPD